MALSATAVLLALALCATAHPHPHHGSAVHHQHHAVKPWMNIRDTPEDRAKKLVAEMTTEEKLSLLHGYPGEYVGNVPGIDRLNVPTQKFNDGPQGFRDNARPGSSTSWPSGLTVAASFDLNVMLAWGTAMGKEFYDKGANVQLGPGLCIARVPKNGRNFEYLSGEDPHLGYHLVQPVIKGIQSQGVIANAKHYVNNNQETDRNSVSENVDERTENEIYYQPFAGAVDAGVGSVMCSYNKINDTYSCENPVTLGALKNQMGYKGWVMSDWGATHSVSIVQGLDQEMPGGTYFGKPLEAAVQNGSISMAKVDDSVVRIMAQYFAVGLFDKPNTNKITNNVTSAEHRSLCADLSANSTVLLQNKDNILPFSHGKTKKFALIGLAKDPITHGGGSGQVVPANVADPLSVLRSRLGLTGDQPCQGEVCVYFSDGSNTQEAAQMAKMAEVAVVFVGTTSHEGADRTSLNVDNNGDALVAAVAAAQADTVVVVATPGAILTPWRANVKGIVTNFMPGQEVGTAIWRILFGDANPSGKLPITFPNTDNEQGFTQNQWPGVNKEADYSEKMLFGYRWYDAHKVVPAFPFGHGLSYTTFEYSSITASASSVSVTVKNTGSVAGAEVPQLYISFPASAGEPPQVLRGFSKVMLAPGQATTVTFPLTSRDLSIWDISTHSWAAVKGSFTAAVGSSSRDLRQHASFTV
eukprot:m.146254 g.146254  ORF g.146254 m.146254 type:complete len:696 (-) comp20527_c1_seq1:51-2138(-)